MTALPVVHAVTTDEIIARADFVDRASGVMRALGPRGAVHLRAAVATGRQLYQLAAALATVQESTGAWLVVNDRIDVALSAGARGIQLTSRSIEAGDAIHAVHASASGAPKPALGVSIHTAEDARAAASVDDISWLVVGHVFDTPSHAGVDGRGGSFLREVWSVATLPIIAIGGVRPSHVSGLLADGAYGIAAIRGIWRADDAERAAAEYLSAHDAVKDPRANGGG